MSRETKIGLFAAIALIGAIWGYKFLKGQNILSRSHTFYAVYDDVDNLPVSSPVLINGLQVGIVQSMYLSDKNPDLVVVVLDVDRKVKIPKNAIAIMQTTSFMGNKAITISYRGVCNLDCAVSGDTLIGTTAGLIETMLPEATLEKYFTLIRENIGGVVDTITSKLDQSGADPGQSIQDIKETLSNLRKISENLNMIVASSAGDINRIVKNLEGVSKNINNNNDEISRIIANVEKVTTELAKMDLKDLSEKAGVAFQSLEETLTSLKSAGAELSAILTDVKNGEGTVGMMMQDPSVYENLERTTRNLDLLLQDLRLNPKRYVNVSIFGKRQKSYELPEDDPAFQSEEKPVTKDKQE